ncbi:MAG: DsrE family protein [Chitinivibrionia bacterium]|nr:DsrE family protein [Chitinivibrionia bacterium]
MKRALLSIMTLIFFSACPILAFSESGAAKTFLIHVKSPMTKHDARTVFIPHLALSALQQGYRVVILFDDDGVSAIKIGVWYGGHTTPLDKTALPEEERRALATLLGVPDPSLPDNYGDFVRFLKGKGVELYANKIVMELRNIGGEKYDHAVTPVGMDRMVEILGGATIYVAY